MAIDIETLAEMVADQIDELPTEATFRGQVINIRVGEAPQSRSFVVAGIQRGQTMEAIMKRHDADPAPAGGETITVENIGYKIGNVTPLASLSDPAGYRLTLSSLK